MIGYYREVESGFAMAITFSGLGSGLPVDTWVAALVKIKQTQIDSISTQKATLTSSNSALTTVKSSFSSLLSSLQTVTDASFGSTNNVFAQNKVTSADSTVVSASVSSLAAKQSLNVFVSQLATNTQAQSTSATPVAGTIDRDTKFSTLANGEAEAGSMSVYVDNTKYSVAVEDDDTVGDVLDKITSATGLWAGVKDGKIRLADAEPVGVDPPASTHNIVVGSAYDTSNFADITALRKNETGGYESNQPIFKVNASALLTSTDAGFATQVQEGSFKIGDATFTVDSETTLNSLLSEINASDKAGVNANWDTKTGKIVLNSKAEGALNINIENLSGNFTDVIGLTTSTYDGDGAVTSSKLVTDSQTLGKVAILKINGSEIISQSNTVTSDVSGIAGLTLTLNKESSGTTTTKLTVGADNTTLTSAINSFVSKFNTVLSNTDEVTSQEGYLYGETTLNMIRNNLRQTVTASVDGQEGYTTLASIGITTGAIGSGLDADTDKIQIDSAKLTAALAADPEAVKQLLIGDGTTDGVFTKLKAQVDGALDSTNGFFVARAKTFTDQITDLNDTISRKDVELADYKITLENKFNLMDQLISSMQSQFSNISSLIGSK